MRYNLQSKQETAVHLPVLLQRSWYIIEIYSLVPRRTDLLVLLGLGVRGSLGIAEARDLSGFPLRKL
jgi:hypothetical protein